MADEKKIITLDNLSLYKEEYDAIAVHKSGDETIRDTKTLTYTVPDTALVFTNQVNGQGSIVTYNNYGTVSNVACYDYEGVSVTGVRTKLHLATNNYEHFTIKDVGMDGRFVIEHGPNPSTTYTLTLPYKSGALATTDDVPTNYVTTDTEQEITKRKAFVSQTILPGIIKEEENSISSGSVSLLSTTEKNGEVTDIEQTLIVCGRIDLTRESISSPEISLN